MRQAGVGHSEAVYQRAFANLLAQRGIPSQTEVPVPYFLSKGGACIGFGRIDILLSSHIIELKVTRAPPPPRMREQLAKYVKAMDGAREGALVCFNQARARAEVSFVARPARSQKKAQLSNKKAAAIVKKQPGRSTPKTRKHVKLAAAIATRR